MRTFLEYFQGDPIMNPRFSNGKDPNRVADRKHVNTVKKEYKHKSSIVSDMVNGTKSTQIVQGAKLREILNNYSLSGEVGTHGLGNSGVEITIKSTPAGLIGTINKKK
jgi:hypothetical protein